MNNNISTTNFRYVFTLYALISAKTADGTRFNALLDSQWYVQEMYPREWNPGEPSELDPATANASIRLQICNDISGSEIFRAYGMKPVDMEQAYYELMTRPKYSDLFRRIYATSSEEEEREQEQEQEREQEQEQSQSQDRRHTYENPYTLQEFQITRHPFQQNEEPFIRKSEYVFVCLLRKIKYNLQLVGNYTDSSSAEEEPQDEYSVDESDQLNVQNLTIQESTKAVVREEGVDDEDESDIRTSTEGRINDLIPFYVSKAYGVTSGLHTHRYILLDPSKFDDAELMIADGAADAYVRPDFNVELHYLELRKHREPASTFAHDPILKLDANDHSKKRLIRICTMVAMSSYFREKAGEVIRVYYATLHQYYVSFRTDEGIREANGKRYLELMANCNVLMTNYRSKNFFISRAYNPFQVFLYSEDPVVGKLYLEMLATNVAMAQDLYNFDEVEI